MSEEIATTGVEQNALTRRSALGATVGLALSTLLVGCGSASNRRRSEALASPMWPDDPVNRSAILDPLDDKPAPLPDRSTAEASPSIPSGVPKRVIARSAWTRAQPIPSRIAP